MLDVVEVAFFGIVGAAMRRYGFAPAPLLIGFILGPMSEEQLRRSLTISRGDPSVFFTRPLCAAGLLAAALVVLWTIYQSVKASRASTISQPISAQH
jgi:putative tricarboxylic transport membrane protein